MTLKRTDQPAPWLYHVTGRVIFAPLLFHGLGNVVGELRKGYHVEHNFGHGSQHLAQVFLVLNLLASLLHTALHLVDDLYQFLRQALHTRVTFFNDLRALCRYHTFLDWEALWLFMIRSLEEDAVPQNIAALISN